MQSLARLSDSLRYNFDGEFMAFVGEHSLGCDPHSENPYSFKIYAIEKALEAGFRNVLWLDSSCFAIANLSPVFDHIEEHGYIMQDAGHFVGTWSSDKLLDYFNMTRDEAMEIRCYGNAGFLGLNFEDETAQLFFKEWKLAMLKGMFKGKWDNKEKTESQDERCLGSRHDLSVGSILRHRLGMELQPSDKWLQYAGVFDEVLNKDILIKAAGM